MKNSLLLLTRELLSEELTELGQLMDDTEGKQVTVSPVAYRKAARTAVQILRKYPRCPYILNAAALSPALIELRSNLALEQAIQLGMCELPQAVRACLVAGAAVRFRR